ncbi:carbon-nitrogen hydrolase family protein [uncultured Gimesia sp.]|uniref:carbon-nitrogen hydrolase family protein n=1 Tax=uncultured Gimesia sp. TaxID=1678688 RepID=UPI00260FFA8E|nr:carbon-nitrogen hydrolase family protein [uncultured Gimesia sp.]
MISENNQKLKRTMPFKIAPIAMFIALALLVTPGSADSKTSGRPVRIVTLSFANGMSLNDVEKLVNREAAKGVDLIVLPETWTGRNPERLNGPTTKAMSALAKKHETYIVSPIYRIVGDTTFNSAILIDRSGSVSCVYDKVCPHPPEYLSKYEGLTLKNALTNLKCGSKAMVFETDFGKVGMAICFDIAFPELWQEMADQGAELVVWPSAYPGGLSLQAHAINHHYYIVAATHNGRANQNCPVVDITGELIIDEGIPDKKTSDVTIARFTLDLDRAIFTKDYNYLGKAHQIVLDHPGDVEIEKFMPHEAWFVLRAKRPGVSVQKLAKQYGLRQLRDSLNFARLEVDKRRGKKLNASLRNP